jgi:hypothetical protein
MEWVQENHEVPREIRRLPSTIYTHPTANLVPGNFNDRTDYRYGNF